MEIVAAEGVTVGVAALLAQIGEADAAPEQIKKGAKAEARAEEGKMTDVMVPALGRKRVGGNGFDLVQESRRHGCAR